jgi:hypothetical protein
LVQARVGLPFRSLSKYNARKGTKGAPTNPPLALKLQRTIQRPPIKRDVQCPLSACPSQQHVTGHHKGDDLITITFTHKSLISVVGNLTLTTR